MTDGGGGARSRHLRARSARRRPTRCAAMLEAEELTAGSRRARPPSSGATARAPRPRLAPLVGVAAMGRAAQRGANCWARSRAAEAVPLLQPLLRGQDARVTRGRGPRAREHQRSGRGARRPHRAARRDRRAAPRRRRCARRAARRPRRPRARAHHRRERAVRRRIMRSSSKRSARWRRSATTRRCRRSSTLMRRKKLFARKKTRALKGSSLAALRSHQDGRRRSAAIDDAAKTGDRMLRKLARAAGGA